MMPITELELEKLNSGMVTVAQILRIQPKHVAAILKTGHALFEQNKLEEAKNIFEGMSVLDGANPYIHGMLGAIYQKQEKYEIALEHYNATLRVNPADIDALTNRGEIALKLGRLEEAASDFKAAMNLDPARKHPAVNRARLLVCMVLDAVQEKNEVIYGND
jgi:tetratricopeptide (TPR) repeat protein